MRLFSALTSFAVMTAADAEVVAAGTPAEVITEELIAAV